MYAMHGLALSATMGPLVALVSAAMTTPPSYRQPTMVVPVLVAFGRGTPRACRAMFLLWLLKSKPPILKTAAGGVRVLSGDVGCCPASSVPSFKTQQKVERLKSVK